jgi:predicted ATP-grasp superfamily ATP-dependent carboligase
MKTECQIRVFLYEFACAAPQWAVLPASLRSEGLAMLSALVADFQRMGNVEVCTLLARDFPANQFLPHSPGGKGAGNAEDEREQFLTLSRSSHFTLAIAPESDGLLETRCRWIDEAGGHSLGCSREAIVLTSDKLALASHLQACNIPTPATRTGDDLTGVRFPAVCKPRFGAGSQATFLVRDEPELIRRARVVSDETGQEALLQPFFPGMAASVAFLVGPRQCLPLLPARQILSDDGRFRYLGGEMPLPTPLAERAVTLAGRAVRSVQGLAGYVGVDLVLGPAEDGSADAIIEINPRLTTSYIGLRQLAESNLAEAMLRVACGENVDLIWCEGSCRFHM